MLRNHGDMVGSILGQEVGRGEPRYTGPGDGQLDLATWQCQIEEGIPNDHDIVWHAYTSTVTISKSPRQNDGDEGPRCRCLHLWGYAE